jgi:hypothetical protein
MSDSHANAVSVFNKIMWLVDTGTLPYSIDKRCPKVDTAYDCAIAQFIIINEWPLL